VFENRVLRGMFGPKRDEVTGEWRKMSNEELYRLYVVFTRCFARYRIFILSFQISLG
jgi:hypothetical protein